MTSDSPEPNHKNIPSKNLLSRFKLKSTPSNITIKDIFSLPAFTGLEISKQKMIKGVIDLSEKNVRDIMIPRVDTGVIPSKMALDPLLKLIEDEGYSRIPVYQDSIDNIIGILYTKDLLKYIPQRTKKIPINKTQITNKSQ